MEETLPQKLPVHLGIIMDGNGRWAKQSGAAPLCRSRRGGGQLSRKSRATALPSASAI